jgi:hypothetical protein
MAKIKFGAIVTDMSGKLGGHVFAKNKGGSYMRTKTTPINPRSAAQMNIRGIFAAISSNWSALAQAGRDSFNAKVADYSKTNVFGDIKNPTGKALFQRLNQNLELTGQAQIIVADSPSEVPFANVLSADGAVAIPALSVTTGNSTVGSKLMIFATPPLSQGTAFVKNKLRLISVLPGAVAGAFDVEAAYSERFGAKTAGSNIVLGVRVVNSNGQASPLETVKAVIVA